VRILVACEFSGTVRDAFIARGHDAVSCDLLPSEKPGPHIQGDVLDHLDDGWDMMIAFPPCTYLCNGGLNWLNRQPGRREKMHEAITFVRALLDAPIPRIALENPIGKISTLVRKPDQVLRAYQFGHPYSKDICLWLKDLPNLQPTNILPPPYRTFDFWSTDRLNPGGGNRKSITFSGVANAMANQWGAGRS
jgi:hypothetical protein